MTNRSRKHGHAPAAPPAHTNDTGGSNLDYEDALQELLADLDLSEKQLDEVLNSVDAGRTPGGDHLTFEEARAYDKLSAMRQQHADTCQFCAGLIQCFLSSEQVTALARVAAQAAGPRSRPRVRVTFPATVALASLAVLSLLSAFVVGRASSEQAVPKADMARYIEELGMLGTQNDDAGAKFRAARLYSDLRLQPQAQQQFLAALQRQNVRQDEIARFLALSHEANEASALERAFARARAELSRRSDVLTTPEACLKHTELELKAGNSTAAYKSFLRYLALIDERPAGAERYDDALAVAFSPTDLAGNR